MFLLTGNHPRQNCPVFVPDASGFAHYALEINRQLQIGQCLRQGEQVYACFMLKQAPAGLRVPLVVRGLEQAPPAAVELTDRGDGALDVRIDGELFTTYQYRSEANRPFLYPVLGPAGVPLTRHYPMLADVPGESSDHPHQRSIWTAHGAVNGFDDWAQGPEMARIEHRAFTAVESGPIFGRFVEALEWVTPSGDLLLNEEREVRFYHTPADGRLIDWEITLRAGEKAVRMGDTKEGGLLSVRVAGEMEGKRGGRIENAWGAVGEAECWGKPAPWCDYSGITQGTHAGIAVFDWRGNPGFPTNWHVRDYGLMTANIFGQQAFQQSLDVCGDRVIQPGAALHFKYRLCLHAGNAQDARLAERYLDYVYPPVVE